ncbi:hypothetical protein N9H93_00930 [Rhizobiaceae bacterium]|nr:hypothetical protein [Rhizobiaceae bacterium]
MMGGNLSFDVAPLLPWWAIIGLAAVAGVLVLFGLYRGLRGSWLRLAAYAALVLALINPVLLAEQRERLKSVVAMVVDASDSQKLDGRAAQTDAARIAMKDLIERMPQFELREISARNGGVESGDASTALFSALRSGLADVPPERVAGAILLTDGQVHDAPDADAAAALQAPVHALLSGSEDDRDRRIEILRAPRFGIVGEAQEVVFRVSDANIAAVQSVEVRAYIDGNLTSIEDAIPGEEASFFFEVPHGGRTVIELRAATVDGEITDVNNEAFTVLDGIRENLRVLLVSGEPHAGERTWRNLLKSDASVDLVHFTILRPPEKQDGTPINELSLIAFPTRELFIEKIDEFDLIIFDRYSRRNVLPLLYFDNIARYLTDGGAILVAAGPEHAGSASIAGTPLEPVLPVRTTGEVPEGPFRPAVTDAGRRHPVTRDLPGLPAIGDDTDADWSRWFRYVGSERLAGSTIMDTGPDGAPLLVLDRPGDGRIAMLMSDHVWLWARGFEGGGPHTQLLRRLGHWLMKEPELAEEALTADVNGNAITVRRQTMGEAPGEVSLITPSGEERTLPLSEVSPGRYEARYDADALGLYRLANGELTALVNVGPANPVEYGDVISTTDRLAAVASATGGAIGRIDRTDPARGLPRIVPVRGNGATAGNGWIGLRDAGATRLIGVERVPLFAGFLGLFALLLLLAGTWAREGR